MATVGRVIMEPYCYIEMYKNPYICNSLTGDSKILLVQSISG